ncbi:MAG: hypothetical protein ACYTGZ_00395 [Planctomycetota bacterium]
MFSRLEQAPVARLPLAALLLLVVLFVVEPFLHAHRVWFSDRAAYQWQRKQIMMDDGRFAGDIALLGSSIVFHSIDATAVNEMSGSDRKLINLGFNGMQLNGQHQMLRRYRAAGNEPSVMLLELRRVEVQRQTWVSGPYWRGWATPGEFLEGGSQYFEPSLILPFLANRVSTAFSYRRSLDNYIFSCLRGRGIVAETCDRNLEVAEAMERHLGYGRAAQDDGLTPDQVPAIKPRPWRVTRSGEVWLHRLLRQCADAGMEVVILQPPVPPFVLEGRNLAGFDEAFREYYAALKRDYPELRLRLLWPQASYGLSDFSDDHHLSHAGSLKLTRELAEWIRTESGG